MNITYKYKPKRMYQIVYISLLCIGLLLTIGRWYSVIDDNFVVINQEIHSHISNFSLSMIAYLGIGYMWLLSGLCFRKIVILGVCMVGANFMCETVMGFMNTTDIMDAIYGVLGILVVFIFLFITYKYGLQKNDIKTN